MNSMDGNATFTVSIDLESAWGDKGREKYMHTHVRERQVLKDFLLLCEKYDIPCTWATVGNLFLKNKKEAFDRGIEIIGRGKIVYGDSNRIDRNQEVWFGEDIIRGITTSRVQHEIGCHTFFHSLTSEVSPEEYRRELEQCKQIAQDKFGVTLRSFVYPRNEGGLHQVVAAAGFDTVRTHDRSVQSALGGLLSAGVRNVFEEFCATEIPVTTATRTEEGLIALRGTYFFPMILKERFRTPMYLRVLRVRKGIKAAILQQKNVHIWFHPQNIALEPTYWLSGFEEVFKAVRTERARGTMSVATMGMLADNYIQHESRHM